METDLNTLVFRGKFNKGENPLKTELCGLKSSAWMRGDALAEKDKLEDFVREIAAGNIDDPEAAADKLMDEMNFC